MSSAPGYSKQIGAPRRHRQRHGEANKIVRWISNHGLIEIADLDINISFQIGNRT
jgi:hypothetical protein